jgi:hypothetical protein
MCSEEILPHKTGQIQERAERLKCNHYESSADGPKVKIRKSLARHQWLMPVILATWETEIRRTVV